MRNKTFMFLNTMGLAIGMAGFIMIMLWVKDELSYDKYNEKASRIVRTHIFYSMQGNEHDCVVCPAPMGPTLKSEFPEVENFVRFRNYGGNSIRYEDKSFNESNVIFADSTVFDVFTIQLIKGDPKTALKAPNTITISESMAKKYFGTTDPIYKMLKLDNEAEFQVTGVYKDIPTASHFDFDFIASIYSYDECNQPRWVSFNFVTYILLKENTDPKAFEKKLSLLVDKYISVQISQFMGASWEEIKKSGTWAEIKIQRLEDIHLHSHTVGELSVNSDIKYVYIFSIIALFILILACINFTNLSTAKSLARSKEVGLRKMFGVQKFKLIQNFLIESFIVVFIAHIVAMIFVELLLPYFNELSQKSLSVNYLDPILLLGLLGLIIITSLFAGSYPAFYLSSFKPMSAIKSEISSGKKKTTLRSVLVVGQFVISIVLLTSTLILNQQLNYIQNKKLGYGKENLLAVWNANLLGNSIESFKEELLKNPNIKNATISGYLPIPSGRSNSVLFKDGIKSDDISKYELWRVDYDYFRTIDLKIVKGREFSKEFSTDSVAVVINQAAAKSFGWDDPIGKTIGEPINPTDVAMYNVIGVVEDFNYESAHYPIEPLVIFLQKSTGAIAIRLTDNSDIRASVSFLESKWKQYAPDQPFEFTFFEERLNQLYKSDRRLGKILMTFTFLAFFVSCLGLFGLALFSTEQRKKEIGIRKVNGASISQTVLLLSYDFTKLVIIALIIACPISYYFMTKWLENFAYRTNISIWVFVGTALVSYLVAMLAISFQSYRAAAANPVDTLRNE
jgi:putative ABC transport system permease protein